MLHAVQTLTTGEWCVKVKTQKEDIAVAAIYAVADYLPNDPREMGCKKLAKLFAAAPELMQAVRDLLDLPCLGTNSYCEICEGHAPKDEPGNIIGRVRHADDCPVALAKAAITKAEWDGPPFGALAENPF